MLSNLESVKTYLILFTINLIYLPSVPVHLSAWDLRILWALLSNIVPSLRIFSVCRLPCRGATRAGVTAWVPTHAPILWVTRPGSTLPTLRAMHADHLLGRDLPTGRFRPSGFPAVVCTAASLHLMHKSFVSRVSPFWYWGCGLRTTFLYLFTTVWDAEALTPLPCHLLLCCLLHDYPYSWVSGGNTSLAYETASNAFIMLILKTPEAMDFNINSFLSCSTF